MKKLFFLLSIAMLSLQAIGQSCSVNFSSYIYGDTSIHAYSSTTGTDSASVYYWYVISQTNDTVYQKSSTSNFLATPHLAPGVYNLCLAVYNGGILCGYDCKLYLDTIPQGCTVSSDFTIVSQSGDSVIFLASDTNDLRYWYYGDGTNSYQLCTCHPVEPLHVYPGSGTYQVCLHSYTSGSCGDTVCQSITINGPSDSCQGLSAYWNVYHQSGDTIQFLAYDTISGDHRYWFYGDGTNSYSICQCHPVDPVHIYPGPGTYHACLYNYRPGVSCPEDSLCRTITVTGPATDSCAGVSSNWYVVHQSGDTVQFLAADTAAGDHRYWYYGDGTNSATICQCHPIDPVHIYPGPGTYLVCLYNYRPGTHCPSDSVCQTIVIAPHDTNVSCANLSLSWNYNISGDTLNFHFCFYSASGNCNDSLCQDISLVSTLILHLDEISGNNNIQLFPNPFNQYTTVHINESTHPPFTLSIYDADGNQVKQQTVGSNQFNIERDGLASGVYLFRIFKDGQVIGKGKMIAK